MNEKTVLIIGASAAGLATAACLKRSGIAFRLVEKSGRVGGAWLQHYDRLHLHTPKQISAMPHHPWPAGTPTYPSRQAVQAYLADYVSAMGLAPEFGVSVKGLSREGGAWRAETQGAGTITAGAVVVATGYNAEPIIPDLPGRESFSGRQVHSSAYRSGREFAGQKVLVVGFGNSACEIALDLAEQGAAPTLAVRSPVNVLSRETFGVPTLRLNAWLSFVPDGLMDLAMKPLNRLMQGNLRRLGLTPHPKGARAQFRDERRVALIDHGTMAAIRAGRIAVRPGVAALEPEGVRFADGRAEGFDAVVWGTGYGRGLSRLVDLTPERLADMDQPIGKQRFFGQDGLYFCGFYLSPRGMLNEIAHEARGIADGIASSFRAA